MALDSIFAKALTMELADKLTGGKIEKVQQPARGTLVFTVKAEKRIDLFVGGSSGAARINITTADFEKPVEPPMFCMLLRKHLVGARILSVEQPGIERVIIFHLAAPGMFGEGEERTLIVELLGRTANIILLDGEGIITDCLYRLGSVEDKRTVLPGMIYRLPPKQDKRSLEELSDDEIAEVIHEADDGKNLDKVILSSFLGISPLTARELSFKAYGDTSPRMFEVRAKDDGDAAVSVLCELAERLRTMDVHPHMLLSPDGLPFDFSYMPIEQYGADYKLIKYDSFSELLEAFSARRDEEERRRHRAREITKNIKNARDRVARRLASQRDELEKTENREYLRQCGDIITSNIHAMKKGMSVLRAYDFYSEDGGEREIRLDPLKTPQQNAAKYYKDYNRAKSAVTHLTEQIALGEDELQYLDSVLDELERAETERDVREIRAELLGAGYIRETKAARREKRQATGPMRFRTDSGYEVRIGRNNVQNDVLTLKNSAKTDIWLHTQKIPGSHVIISGMGSKVDDGTIMQAAQLAAFYSSARTSGKVPVDYTLVKYVKKPSGARPGKVIYTDYKTVYAAPDEQLAERLKV